MLKSEKKSLQDVQLHTLTGLEMTNHELSGFTPHVLFSAFTLHVSYFPDLVPFSRSLPPPRLAIRQTCFLLPCLFDCDWKLLNFMLRPDALHTHEQSITGLV